MRATLAAILLVSGCIGGNLSPGVLREDWGQPRRDPDPTRNPTEEAGNPWAEEEAVSGPRPCDAERRELIERTAATVLTMVAVGWTPLLVYHGTFEEVPDERRRQRAKEAARQERCAAE